MIIDNRGLLLSSHLSSSGLGKKSLKSSIDNSSVASTEQKTIDLGFNDHGHNQATTQDKEQGEKSKKTPVLDLSAIAKEKEYEIEKKLRDSKIIRDPLILLKAF